MASGGVIEYLGVYNFVLVGKDALFERQRICGFPPAFNKIAYA